jgi:hypothetical protein
MGKDFQKRYNERAAYRDKVRQRKVTVAGRKDFNFSKHVPPELRGTYEGQALIDKWHRECFVPDYLDKLEYEVDDLAELAAWEKNDDERFRRKNRLPPSPEARRAAIDAKRAAAVDEPPPLPPLPADADDAMTATAVGHLQRDEITLFGSTRPIKQVVPLKKKTGGQDDDI